MRKLTKAEKMKQNEELNITISANPTINELASKEKKRIERRAGGKTPRGEENNFPPNGATKSEYHEQVMSHLLQYWSLPMVTSADEARARVTWYFEDCIRNQMKPTVEALAMALGCSRVTLLNWINRAVDGVDDRYSVAKEAREFIQSVDAQLVIDNKMPAVPYIFRAKNNYDGYHDQQETVIKFDDPLGSKTSPENLLTTISEDVIDIEFEESDLTETF